MKWRISILLLCLVAAHRLVAAPRDLLSCTVQSDGYTAEFEWNTMATNGTFVWGFDPTNIVSGNEAVVFTVVDDGFDDTGQAIKITNQLYATTWKRRAYPNEAIPDQTASGGDAFLRVILSDYVYLKSTNITVTVKAGWYYDGSNSNKVATDFSVINNSTVPYPKVVANWTWPHYEAIETNAANTYTLRALAFHRSGRSNRPVRVVQFWGKDQSGNITPTNFQSTMTLSDIGDALPFGEYKADLYFTNLTQGDVVTNYFRAYPWVGDANSVLDAGDGAYADNYPYWCPQKLLCNKEGSYGQVIAVVATNGVSAGVASTNALDTNTPPTAFNTIAAACNAIRGTNNLHYGHQDTGNGIIYLEHGQHSFTGGTITGGEQPLTWLTITAYPGHSSNDVLIVDGTGDGDPNDRVRMRGIYIKANAGFVWSACSNIWFDQCICNVADSGSDMIDGTAQVWWTRNTVTNYDQGLVHFGGNNQVFQLIRGNAFYESNCYPWNLYTTIGNYKHTTNGVGSFFDSGLSGLPTPYKNSILYNNILFGVRGNNNTLISLWNSSQTLTNGAAIVQNVIEGANTNNGTWPGTMFAVAADNSTGHVTNVIIWHNVILGERASISYNDTGSAAAYRSAWSVVNNIIQDINTKHDTFGTQDGARVGGWPFLYGVGSSGNLYAEMTNVVQGSDGSFLPRYPGLNSYEPSWSGTPPSTSTPNEHDFIYFTDIGAFVGTNINTWGHARGDYTLTTNSPAVGLPLRLPLAYDVAGQAWTSSNSAAGAYRYEEPVPPGESAERRGRLMNFRF